VRVLFFHAYAHQYAGAQRVTELLARALPDRGFRARVVLPAPGPFLDRLRAAGIDVRLVAAPRIWARYGRELEGPRLLPALAALPGYWLTLAGALRRWRPSIVHCNDHRGLLLAGPAARLAGIPLVWHVHGAYAAPLLDLLGILLASRVLVVSRATLASLPLLARFSQRVRILANGLPPEAFDRESFTATTSNSPGRIPPGDGLGSKLVICAARINPDKGLDVLLEAAARLRSRIHDARFEILGGLQSGYEHHAAELEKLRHERGLLDMVVFRGFIQQPRPLIAAADVYVQPSRAEPFGLGVLEAMALGVPVIASRAGGLVDIVEDEVSGLLVPPGDPAALSAAIQRLLGDRELARRLGEAGRQRALRQFSLDRMLDRLIATYSEVLE
jgi:glycosyltransferase involved in cell wall biosynthesis